jgi:hypoxanthine phosphoribosyltransferase
MISVHGRLFRLYISRAEIEARVAALGAEISRDYEGLQPLVLAVLNGSFIFAADLFRSLHIEAGISFIKLASYAGTSSTGKVVTAIGLEESLRGRHVIVLEDIIDTGRTLHGFLPELAAHEPASVRIVALLTKPEALEHELHAHYIGFEIPNDFVVGYGLDYDGLGRNLPELYTLVD